MNFSLMHFHNLSRPIYPAPRSRSNLTSAPEASQVLCSMKVKLLVFPSHLTLCDPMDCSLRGSSVLGIFQARILGWVAISSSRGSFQREDQGSHWKQSLYNLSHQWGPYYVAYVYINMFEYIWMNMSNHYPDQAINHFQYLRRLPLALFQSLLSFKSNHYPEV